MRYSHTCAIWFIFAAISFALALVQGHPVVASILWVVTIYALQGFIAELLGVRMNRTTITIPRRLAPRLPFLVLWREQIKYSDIHKIKSRRRTKIRVLKNSGKRIRVAFSHRANKMLFFRLMKQTDPSINIYH